MHIKEYFQAYQARTERTLDRWLPKVGGTSARLHEAMRYAATNGGKHVRPAIVYATGRALGVASKLLDGPACAVELIHAYSLIHDDLPAMDNDDLRRGKPTCHKAFDEATAILAGDALQSLAYYILAHDAHMVPNAERRLQMIATLAWSSGSSGMVGGQAIDLAAVGTKLSLPELENMHIHKTGALIRASVTLGALSRQEIDKNTLGRLDQYAKYIGLAFQVRDDILDVEGDTSTIGKTQGADIARNKPTYPSLIGLADAQRMALDAHEQALECLRDFGEQADQLRWISEYAVRRDS